MHYRDRRRLVAAVLFLIAAGLLAGAVNGTWWEASLISTSPGGPQVQSVTVSYQLTGAIDCAMVGWHPPTPCNNVTSSSSGGVRVLEAVIDPALEILAGAAVVAAVFSGLGAYLVTFGRLQLTLTFVLVLAIVAASLALALASIGVFPGPQAAVFCEPLSGNQTSCGSFWGSVTPGLIAQECTRCFLTMQWGPSLPWYATVLAVGPLLGGWYLLWIGRKGPFTRDELVAWSRENRPVSLAAPTPVYSYPTGRPSGPVPEKTDRPAAGLDIGPSRLPGGGAWKCPSCRTVNSPWAQRCALCGTPPPEPDSLSSLSSP